MKAKSAPKNVLVSVVMGSDSDLPTMTETTKVLEEFGIGYELILTSAHRTPQRTTKFAALAAGRGIKIIIVGAGAAAHLAGALGNTCWVLLPHHKTDWRWLTEREDSPWYPGTMRLFRQSGGQGWASVIEEVAVAFHHFVQEWHASKAAQTPSLQAGMHL